MVVGLSRPASQPAAWGIEVMASLGDRDGQTKSTGDSGKVALAYGNGGTRFSMLPGERNGSRE